MGIPIQIGDRWAIVGASGTGKTVLSREILKTIYRATVGRVPIGIIDSKISGDFKLFEADKKRTKVVTSSSGIEAAKVLLSGKWSFVIWRPQEDDPDEYNAYFKYVYMSARNKKTASVTFVDELSSICSQIGKPPRYYDILLKQGRGMHNGMISVTQSPSFIPANLLRQATHIIRFNMNDEYDAKKLTRSLGPEAMIAPPDDFGFWYRNCLKPIRRSPAQYYSDFKDFIGA